MAGAVEPRLGIRVQAEFRARAAADEHEACPLATCDIGSLVIGHKMLEQAAAEGRRLTRLEKAQVLDKKGHTLQRSFGKPDGDRLARLLVLLVNGGVNNRINLFGPCACSFQHLLDTDLALCDELSERGGVVLAIFFEPHGGQISITNLRNDHSC